MRYFEKHAKVFGNNPQDYIVYTRRAKVEDLVDPYKNFIKAKALEPETPWWKAMVGGSLMGAPFGALVGGGLSPSGSKGKGALVGAAGAAAIGSLFGGMSKIDDDREIAEAKAILSSVNKNKNIKMKLLKHLDEYDRFKEWPIGV